MAIPRFRNLQANDPFFAQEDHAVFTSSKVTSSRYDKERQQIRDKFLALHDVLYPEMKREGLALYPHWHPPNIVSTWYIGRIEQIWFMKLRYLRSSTEVQAVEEMMGVPKLLDYSETQYTKHPMMDIRIDSEYLAIELLVTDKAWLDAQNFKRKLERHKAECQHFIHILQSLGHDYIFGGWPDTSGSFDMKTAISAPKKCGDARGGACKPQNHQERDAVRGYAGGGRRVCHPIQREWGGDSNRVLRFPVR